MASGARRRLWRRYFWKTFKPLVSRKNLPLAALAAVFLSANFLLFLYPLETAQKALNTAKARKWLGLGGISTLAVMDAYLLDGKKRIRKVRRGRRIYLEIYEYSESGSLSLTDRIQLEGRSNGYFEYSGKRMGQNFNETISLAVLDQEGDGQMEIAAPAFDRFFLPRINLVFYNRKKGKYELSRALTAPSIQ